MGSSPVKGVADPAISNHYRGFVDLPGGKHIAKMVDNHWLMLYRVAKQNFKEDVCAIRVNITGEQRNVNPVIDMKWFLGFVLDHPGFKVEFDGCTSFAWEASDLVKLVDVVKSNTFWCTRLASFESIKLQTYTCWRPGRTEESGRYARRPVWILQIVLEPGDVQDRVNSEECRAYTKGWLVDMGLRTIDEAERKQSTFKGLKIQVFKNDRSSALDSGEYYW